MLRLSAKPGLVMAVLVSAIGTWWLAGVALQLGSGSADLHAWGARAAAAVILTQWMLIALLTAPARSDSQAGSLLAVSLPLWPLLALLWLTSRLSAIDLVASQLLAVLLAMLMIVIAKLITTSIRGAEVRQLATAAAGVVLAAMIWAARGPLIAWVSS